MRWIDATGLAAVGVLALGVQESLPSADAVLAELKAAMHITSPRSTSGRIRRLRVSRRWRRTRALTARF